MGPPDVRLRSPSGRGSTPSRTWPGSGRTPWARASTPPWRREPSATGPDAAEARAYCRGVRERWLRLPGGLPGDPPRRRDGAIQTHGKLVHRGVRITRLTYKSLPGVPVAGLLYRLDAPAERRRRERPGIVFVCGHYGTGQTGGRIPAACAWIWRCTGWWCWPSIPGARASATSTPAPRRAARWCRPAPSSTPTAACSVSSPAAGSARYFAWDAVRAVDVLAALPEVDAARIGATGNSGGGMQTMLLMMADERLAAAMPCTYITGCRSSSARGRRWTRSCASPLPGAGIDHADLLAGFAPRPLLVGGAAYDYFPIEGTEHAFQEARRLYALQGAADRIRLAVGGHLPLLRPRPARGGGALLHPRAGRRGALPAPRRSLRCRRGTWGAAPPARSTATARTGGASTS